MEGEARNAGQGTQQELRCDRATRPSDWRRRSAPLSADLRRLRKAALLEQVGIYNEVTQASPSATALEFARRLTRQYSGVHLGLLNLFALWGERRTLPKSLSIPTLGPLLLLETHLESADQARISVAGYRSMLRDSTGLENLIGELDACAPVFGPAFKPHQPTSTDPGSKTNYDLHWSPDQTARGDIKWFQTWVLRDQGTSLHAALSELLLEELRHNVRVHVGPGPYSEATLTQTAVEVLALYDAAVNNAGEAGIAIVEGEGTVVATRSEESADSLVKRVSVSLASSGGKPSLQVLEHDLDENEADVRVVRRCLLDGARQLPKSTPPDVTFVVLGSRDPFDSEYAKNALVPGDTAKLPGFFEPNSSEKELDHVNGCFHFAITYAPDSDDQIRVCRTVKHFAQRTNSRRQNQMMLDYQSLLDRQSTLRIS